MRTAIKKNLLVALMFGTLLGYANETTNPINFVGGKKVKVEFKDVKKGQTLTIKDENGVTIYKQTIQSSGVYSKIFDLTALKNGVYTTELEKDFEIVLKKLEVKNGSVKFLENENTKVFKPVIRKEDDLVLISKIAFNNQPVKVTLYYENDIVLSETLNGKDDLIKRVYKLSKSYRGDYKVIINTDNRSYTKNFDI